MTEHRFAVKSIETAEGNLAVLRGRARELVKRHGITEAADVAVCLGISEAQAAQLLAELAEGAAGGEYTD